MRFNTPILINLVASLNIASAQACDSGTACGYYGTLCCTGDEVCMTDADNQAVCKVPALASLTAVGSMGSGEAMSAVVVGVSTDSAVVTEALIPIPTPTGTQVTGVESSESMSGTGVGGVSGSGSGSTTSTAMLSESVTQSADASGAGKTVATGSADTSGAQASTKTGAGGRVERCWYGVVGVGVILAMMLVD